MNSTTTFLKDPDKFYVMGTGSRSMRTDPNAQAIYENLCLRVLELKEEHQDKLVLISGMAEGWDEAIAKSAIRHDIPFIAAIPNSTYGDYYWGSHSVTGQNRLNDFKAILAHAIHIEVVCPSVFVNGQHSNFIRNQWMVNYCDYALAYQANSSGTRDAVARLRQASKNYDVYPFKFQQQLEI